MDTKRNLAPETEVRATLPDLDAGWRFYRLLGLEPIVDARPHYLLFRRVDGGGTLALDQGRANDSVATINLDCPDFDRLIRALRDADIALASHPEQGGAGREAEIRDPGGNRVVLHEMPVETQRAA